MKFKVMEIRRGAAMSSEEFDTLQEVRAYIHYRCLEDKSFEDCIRVLFRLNNHGWHVRNTEVRRWHDDSYCTLESFVTSRLNLGLGASFVPIGASQIATFRAYNPGYYPNKIVVRVEDYDSGDCVTRLISSGEYDICGMAIEVAREVADYLENWEVK